MYTDEQLDQLEQEEHAIIEKTIILLLLLLGVVHEELEKELRSFYQKYGDDGVVTYAEARKWVSDKDHRRRLMVLLLFVNARFKDLLSELEEPFRKALVKVIEKESAFFDIDLDVDDLILDKWGIDDLHWLGRLEDDIELWTHRIASDIKQSILKQEHIDDILEEMDRRFLSMEKVLKRLALTESTAMGSMARKQIFKELGVKKYRFYAREDERTCDECGALHGLIFPISAYEIGVTASPIHAHCRCWEVPIMD